MCRSGPGVGPTLLSSLSSLHPHRCLTLLWSNLSQSSLLLLLCNLLLCLSSLLLFLSRAHPSYLLPEL